MSWLNQDARPSKFGVFVCCVVTLIFVLIVLYNNPYWRDKMRAGERVMRERQVLVNQITIMAGIKLLLRKAPQSDLNESVMRVASLDVSIQVTSRLLRGMPIDQEETNANKIV